MYSLYGIRRYEFVFDLVVPGPALSDGWKDRKSHWYAAMHAAILYFLLTNLDNPHKLDSRDLYFP